MKALQCKFLLSSVLSLIANIAIADRLITEVTLNGSSEVSVSSGDTITVSITVSTDNVGANHDWKSTSYTLNAVTNCIDSSGFDNNGVHTDQFTISAPTAAGSYNLALYAHRAVGCNPPADSNQLVLIDAIEVIGSTLDHYSISAGINGSACFPATVIIRAEDSDNALLTDHTDTVNISTSSGNGNWSINSASGGLSPNPDNDDNGAANYQFVLADNGDMALDLENTHAETLTITVSNGTVSSTSSTMTFGENAFVISPVDSLGDDIVAARDHDFRAQVVRRDPTSGDCGVASEYNVNSVKAWYNPHGDDPGGRAPELITASETQMLPAAEPGGANLSLPFVSGEAFFSLSSSDVGKYSFSFRDDSYRFSDQDIATSIPGDSAVYVVRPFGFAFDIDSNPAASDSDGPVFTTAGSNFEISLRAVGWQAADDLDNDGEADGHADGDPANNSNLADNDTLAGFGRETSPESITLSSTLLAPGAGDDPGLSGVTLMDSFSGGAQSNSSVSFSEVGVIEINAAISSNNYLGAGTARTAKAVSRSAHVGRFIPHHFSLDSGDVAPACISGNFTYLSQPTSGNFSIGAREEGGAITRNYLGSFVNLGSGNVSYYAIDQNSNTLLGNRLLISNETFNWSGGIGDVTFDLTLGRIDGLNAADGPYPQTAIGILPTDSDGVSFLSADLDLDGDNSGSSESINLGSSDFRYGRLELKSAHGPESVNLPVEFLLQQWDGSTFVINTSDSCSEILLSDISHPDGPLSSGDFGVTVGAGTSTASYPYLTLTAVGFSGGDAGQIFTAPGAGNTGSFEVNVDLGNYSWLQYDWDRDGSYSDNTTLPTATFSFGSYRGHDRVIFWREILN